jgi:hypothetical protein
MGISNLAVDTFSSSGSQSVTRTNSADSSRQITSDFISRPPLKYINGSGTTVIRGTLASLPYSDSSGIFNVDTFRIPNNIDAISEMILNWTVIISAPTTAYDCSGIYYSKTLPLDFIDYIDIKVGGLIIQTMYPGDIYMRNYSETGVLTNTENTFNNKVAYFDTGSIIGHQTASAETLNFSLPLPFIGKSKDKDRSFLQTGMANNTLTVVVNYRYFSRLDVSGNLNIIPLLNNRGVAVTTRLETNLVIQNHIITHTEKNFMKQNVVNRVLNTSSNIYRDPLRYPISSTTEFSRLVLDLDSINLNVTHIMLCLHVGILTDTTTTLPTHYTRFNRGGVDVSSVRISELIDASANNAFSAGDTGNGIYTTGPRRLSSSWGEAVLDVSGTSTNVIGTVGQISNPDVLGVFNGWLSSAELVLGNETTGVIPVTSMNSNQEEFGLKNEFKNFYIIKLADTAFGTAGIPFSRIKNKTLTVNIFNKFLSNTRFGVLSTTTRRPTLYVTACGTTLQNITNNFTTFSYI